MVFMKSALPILCFPENLDSFIDRQIGIPGPGTRFLTLASLKNEQQTLQDFRIPSLFKSEFRILPVCTHCFWFSDWTGKQCRDDFGLGFILCLVGSLFNRVFYFQARKNTKTNLGGGK